ncbi:unnamed protein product [Aureobasidium mustum]|uniref:Uncharacterized protein n=1 Tax=Aureobasidium mustum TaxID=2773714 RepID=A0A9N8K750_9PEZI|nr:unnamed protein product [Aureobasidium mustum]
MTNTEFSHELTGAFASGILNQLQHFWSAHLVDSSHIVVPSTQDLDVWFVDKTDEFDNACRLWFFMPMEHAEDLEMQQLMVEEQKDRFRDMDLLMQGKIDAKDDVVLACRSVSVQRKEELEDCRRLIQKAVDEHYDDIKRFGRFPYRNMALGRTSTKEEQEHLDTLK